jgi:hypothetical protein
VPLVAHKNLQYPLGEGLISRQRLSSRWELSLESLRRRELAGLLHPVRLGRRTVRYRMSEVLALENAGLAHRRAEDQLDNLQERKLKERLISRSALAERLECSQRTLRRYEQEGLLTPMQLDANDSGKIGYRMAEVIALEHRAEES